MKINSKRLTLVAAAAAVALLTAVTLRPSPVRVDTARAVRGPLLVTLDEDGITRVHDRYVLGAPVAGRLQRIGLHAGDPVAFGQEVARLEPAPLEARAREQAQAGLRAAVAAQRAADAQVAQARTALDEAQRRLRRAERLAADRLIPVEELDTARSEVGSRTAEADASRFRAQAAAFEVESARAALLEGAGGAHALVPLRSPVQGRVLRICEECDRVVAAGTPLLELGDPTALEVVVDVLSSDAVQIRPGAEVRLTAGEGEGARELRARVRTVEPSGFIKVSPLGVEEQRVNVVAGLADPPGELGDRYRVEARIVLWEGKEALQVPAGALFRQGDGWAVFVVAGGRAHRREVRVGHRNPSAAEITSGLAAGESVIVHPGDRITDGTRVELGTRNT